VLLHGPITQEDRYFSSQPSDTSSPGASAAQQGEGSAAVLASIQRVNAAYSAAQSAPSGSSPSFWLQWALEHLGFGAAPAGPQVWGSVILVVSWGILGGQLPEQQQ
jgi:hypothetical protein